jgi:putative serine/threonine protein kinase
MEIVDILSKKGLKKIKFFAKGKRSFVCTAYYKNKKVAIKIERNVKGRIKNEVKFLKILNKYEIGPKLIFSGENYFVYKFVEGLPFIEWMKDKSKKMILDVVEKVMFKCRTLDKLGINKKEFHHPVKHILVKNKKLKMIDFERCYYTKKPKNLTQFCQFLI